MARGMRIGIMGIVLSVLLLGWSVERSESSLAIYGQRFGSNGAHGGSGEPKHLGNLTHPQISQVYSPAWDISLSYAMLMDNNGFLFGLQHLPSSFSSSDQSFHLLHVNPLNNTLLLNLTLPTYKDPLYSLTWYYSTLAAVGGGNGKVYLTTGSYQSTLVYSPPSPSSPSSSPFTYLPGHILALTSNDSLYVISVTSMNGIKEYTYSLYSPSLHPMWSITTQFQCDVAVVSAITGNLYCYSPLPSPPYLYPTLHEITSEGGIVYSLPLPSIGYDEPDTVICIDHLDRTLLPLYYNSSSSLLTYALVKTPSQYPSSSLHQRHLPSSSSSSSSSSFPDEMRERRERDEEISTSSSPSPSPIPSPSSYYGLDNSSNSNMISVEWEHRVYLSSASSYFGCFALEKDGSFVVIYQTSMDKLSSNGSLLWSTSSSSFYSPSPSPSLSSSITPSITSSMYSSPSPSPVTHSYSFSHSLSSSHSPSISYTPTPSISMSKSVDPYYNNDASLIAGKLTHPLVAANETLLYFPLQLHSKTGGIETYNLTDGSKLWNFYTQSEGITFLFPLPDPSSLLLIWHDVYYILSSSSPSHSICRSLSKSSCLSFHHNITSFPLTIQSLANASSSSSHLITTSSSQGMYCGWCLEEEECMDVYCMEEKWNEEYPCCHSAWSKGCVGKGVATERGNNESCPVRYKSQTVLIVIIVLVVICCCVMCCVSCLVALVLLWRGGGKHKSFSLPSSGGIVKYGTFKVVGKLI